MTKKPDVIGYADLVDQTGIKRGTLRVMYHRGELPEYDYPNIPAWLQTTIDAWLLERKNRGADDA